MHDPVLKRSGFPNFFSSFKTAIINIKSVLYISLYFFQRFGYFSGQPPLFVNAINIIIFLICRHRFQQRGYYSGKQSGTVVQMSKLWSHVIIWDIRHKMHQKWGKNYTHNELKIDLKVVNLMWNFRWSHDHNLDYDAYSTVA